jgi:hypothetical protein
VVDKVEDGKEFGSKWICKVKRQAHRSIDKFKAQLVAKGVTQCPGYDFNETYTPNVRFDSLQLLLAITVVQGWHPQQVDIKSAFFYGDLEEEIYMTLPKGSHSKGKTVRV